MQTDGDMFLQIQRFLKGAQHPLIVIIVMRRQHVHLLIALGDEVDGLLLAHQKRRQGFFRVGMLGQHAVFRFAVIRQFPVQQAQRLAQRLFAPEPEPEPVKQAIPQRAQRVDQQRFPDRHISCQAQCENRRDQRGRKQTRVKGA